MPTARPSSVAVFMTKIDICMRLASTQMAPRVVDTASAPVITGSAAATRLPKTKSSATRVIGKAYDSTVRRSCDDSFCRSSRNTGSPVIATESGPGLTSTRMRATSPQERTRSASTSNTSRAIDEWPSRDRNVLLCVLAYVRTWRSPRTVTGVSPLKAACSAAMNWALPAFSERLLKMMSTVVRPWCRRCRIWAAACSEGDEGSLKPPPCST